VTEEGQQHFKSVNEAMEFLRTRAWMPYVYRDDGLVVGWGKTLARKQLNVDVWQIFVNGQKPTQLPGSQNEKIIVTHVELWTAPLGKAIAESDARAMQDLLAGGADPNATNIVGRPVLVEAAKRGNHEIIQVLLKKGADPNKRDELGSTALHVAAVAGHVEAVKALVAGGADINVVMEGQSAITPLMLAAAKHADIVKILLEKGADVNARTYEGGHTAMFFARMYKREDIVALLKAAGTKD
jgi:ankyrin repeat protein